MPERLEDFEREYADIEARIADPDVIADRERHVALTRRYKELEAIVTTGRALRRRQDDLATAREMLTDASGEDREMLRAEVDDAEAAITDLGEQYRLLLLPRDPNDDKNVIVELRGAEGGEEANLFARDLLEMYRAYAARMGWSVELLGSQPSDMGGVSEASFLVKGDGVWSRLKHEAGTHRVQRVPVTESQGRIHTSSATVNVLPEAEEIDVQIDPNDLQIDVYRSSGPGGQSVNTTDSAVRITHKPTGLVVSMQDEKSQLQNRARALQVLRSRLMKVQQDAAAAEASAERRSQVGGGGRADKIRTYNVKENRLTDHRIGLTIYKLDKVLAGELDEVVDALVAADRAEAMATSTGGG